MRGKDCVVAESKVLVILILLLVSTGCSAHRQADVSGQGAEIVAERAADEVGEDRDPYNMHRGPRPQQSDWFLMGYDDDADGKPDGYAEVAFDEVLSVDSHPMLLRLDESGNPMKPHHVLIGGTIADKDGNEVRGYIIRYDDRIEIEITPVDRPRTSTDLEPMTEDVLTPNTRGETSLYRRAEVRERGAKGIAKESGVIASGDQVRGAYPSRLVWFERGSDQVPTVMYRVSGDIPVERLQDVVGELGNAKSALSASSR